MATARRLRARTSTSSTNSQNTTTKKATRVPKLREFYEKPKRFKVAVGGRGSGKSQTIATYFVDYATRGAKIGCFRELQNSIEDSVHSLLKSQVEDLGLNGFDITDKAIRHGSGGEFKFRGLSRNPGAVKSMQGFQLFWVEEAQDISEDSLRQLTPTLREAGSEVWFSMNPMSSADPMSKRFIEPFLDELLEHGRYEDEQHLIIWCNHEDNPWFPEVLEKDRRWDYDNLPRASYDHIWKGAYNDHVENALILAEWYDAAVDAHKKLGFEPKGIKAAAHDPSDEGDDEKGYALRHGSVFTCVEGNDAGDVNEGSDWAVNKAIAAQADVYAWDCDGLGAPLRRDVHKALEGKHTQTIEYRGNATVERPDDVYEPVDRSTDQKAAKNKELFKNLRAQKHWELRDRFYKTWRAVEKGIYTDPDELISIDSTGTNVVKLRAEVCRVPLKPNPSGLIWIMDKPTMKRMGIDSPNMFDSMVMTMATPKKRRGPLDLSAESPWR